MIFCQFVYLVPFQVILSISVIFRRLKILTIKIYTSELVFYIILSASSILIDLLKYNCFARIFLLEKKTRKCSQYLFLNEKINEALKSQV